MRLLLHNTSYRFSSTDGGRGEKLLKHRLGEAVLYGIYMCMSYFVMLVVMTYNVGLFIAVILGFCFGQFLFPRFPAQRTSVGLVNSIASEIESCH